ncbi:histidine biosynthesis trifunctional-protein [Gaertneriomyces semiglobifer]|nr:histidine biosynthesis trifunctional-protein [Gaertneriomyces semiglobifer]
MVLPSISQSAALADRSIIEKLALVGDVLITQAQGNEFPASIIQEFSAWVELPVSTSLDTIVDLLDTGATRVVLPTPTSSIDEFAQSLTESVPRERVVASIAIAELEDLEERLLASLTKAVAGVVVDIPDAAEWPKVSAILKKYDIGLLARVAGAPDLAVIAAASAQNVDFVISSEFLSVDGEVADKLDVGEAYAAALKSDRPDGLFPTMVVDEQGVALGLCYSSVRSISESIRTGQGVYQSRARGLWYKGASSGATQTLRKITADCDNDTLRFTVSQKEPGFCHLNTRTCFGQDSGISGLASLLERRKKSAPAGSYTKRLFEDEALLRSKIMEEAEELCDAKDPDEIAWEAADLIYFALTRCTAAGVTLADIEKHLDRRSKKVNRRAGNAKPKWDFAAKEKAAKEASRQEISKPVQETPKKKIKMQVYEFSRIDQDQRDALLLRPIIKTDEIMARVQPIMQAVRSRGDAALLELTEKFDRVKLDKTVIKAPFDPALYELPDNVRIAIDQAYENIYKFHEAQLDRSELRVETMPGVVCTRFFRPIERVGLYVPGGTAVLPSSTLMLGVPAKVAGCSEIVVATPPKKDGTVAPEVMYVANKIGASTVLIAGGAQAVAAMAYGTANVPKVDKICGPGNQYVTAAKMVAQADSSAMISIDMPAGPSELLVIADSTSNPAYVASDLLSQAEHGVDSQVVLLAVNLTDAELAAIEREVEAQGEALPRADIVREAIAKSFILRVDGMEEAMAYSNRYAPEHLILHMENAEQWVKFVDNAGSVFVGPYSPESCGDYASGTNHTLPTYGYARMYSGVNTLTFVKHITSQMLTREGLDLLGDTVTTLAEIEGLEAHRNAVAIRLKDIRAWRA